MVEVVGFEPTVYLTSRFYRPLPSPLGYTSIWRLLRDSNSQTVSRQRFSRPPDYQLSQASVWRKALYSKQIDISLRNVQQTCPMTSWVYFPHENFYYPQKFQKKVRFSRNRTDVISYDKLCVSSPHLTDTPICTSNVYLVAQFHKLLYGLSIGISYLDI